MCLALEINAHQNKIETVNDKLKNIYQIEHSKHRSVVGFLLEVVSGLLAYTFQPKKTSLGLLTQEIVVLKQS
ncbi:hypothetical protein ID855_20920 [Xenorhabdus sp. ZM]|nr:hypothetical protein [Xenorhabdus sp. ZM]